MDQIKNLALISSFSALAACGGGSGGSDTAQSTGLNQEIVQVTEEVAVVSGVVTSSPNQAYDGVQGQMTVTEGNTRNLLDAAFSGGALDSVQDISKPANPQTNTSVFSTVEGLFNQVIDTLNQSSKSLPANIASKIDFDQTIGCDSGNFRAFGELENNGVGTLSMTLNNCRFGSVSLDGNGEFEINEFNVASSLITQGAIRFNDVSATSTSGPDYRLDGEESYVLDQSGSTAEVSSVFNLVVAEVGGSIVWFENFEEEALVNVFTNEVDLTISGRIHQSDLGYVDVSTLTTIETSLIGGDFALPDPGGELLFEGSNSSNVLFTTFSTGVTMDIDEDGDGTTDISETLTYEEIASFNREKPFD